MDLNTAHENKKRVDYDYKIGDKVLGWHRMESSAKHKAHIAKSLDYNDSSYEWNYQDSMQNKVRKTQYPESNTLYW